MAASARREWSRQAVQTAPIGPKYSYSSDRPQKLAFAQQIELRINEMVSGVRYDVAVKI